VNLPEQLGSELPLEVRARNEGDLGLDLNEDSGGLRRAGVDRFNSRIRGWSQLWNKITFIPQLKGHVLTPKFGKESDLWVRFEKESVWWKEGYFQRFSAKRSAVGYLLQFGKGTVELILRDWTVTWLKSRETNGGTGDRA
jgi:hypothetical protein